MSKTALSILAVAAYLWWSHSRGVKATTQHSAGNPAGTSWADTPAGLNGPGNRVTAFPHIPMAVNL